MAFMVYPLNANKECDFSWLILLNRNQYHKCADGGRFGAAEEAPVGPFLLSSDVGSGLSKGQGSAKRGSSLCKAWLKQERELTQGL